MIISFLWSNCLPCTLIYILVQHCLNKSDCPCFHMVAILWFTYPHSFCHCCILINLAFWKMVGRAYDTSIKSKTIISPLILNGFVWLWMKNSFERLRMFWAIIDKVVEDSDPPLSRITFNVQQTCMVLCSLYIPWQREWYAKKGREIWARIESACMSAVPVSCHVSQLLSHVDYHMYIHYSHVADDANCEPTGPWLHLFTDTGCTTCFPFLAHLFLAVVLYCLFCLKAYVLCFCGGPPKKEKLCCVQLNMA